EGKRRSFRLVERGAGIVERAVKSAAAAVLTQQFSRIRALNPPQPRFKEKPRLPKRAGLELDRVRPLKSPVSPSAPTRNVAFGSAPDMQRNGHRPAPFFRSKKVGGVVIRRARSLPAGALFSLAFLGVFWPVPETCQVAWPRLSTDNQLISLAFLTTT